jgi:hypothetical protein
VCAGATSVSMRLRARALRNADLRAKREKSMISLELFLARCAVRVQSVKRSWTTVTRSLTRGCVRRRLLPKRRRCCRALGCAVTMGVGVKKPLPPWTCWGPGRASGTAPRERTLGPGNLAVRCGAGPGKEGARTQRSATPRAVSFWQPNVESCGSSVRELRALIPLDARELRVRILRTRNPGRHRRWVRRPT